MDGQNYVVFHAGTDDSYMNSSANFRGADVGATFIDLYFNSATYAGTGAGYDKVRLTVTATFEEVALEAVAGALAGNKNPVMVIADDNKSLYIEDHITAVASITLASQVQTRVYEDVQAAKALSAADSGKILGLDLLAGFTMTLPAIADAGAGWYCDIVVKTVTTSNAYIITEKASADTNKICAIGLEAATTGAQISNAGFTTMTFDATPTKGDKISVYCDGTFYYATVITAADGDMVFA
jgi:hypothetical protein|tara:strand:- start:63 stop:782 length:720 start_codon:yes stop_codon:yes gene_type:complete